MKVGITGHQKFEGEAAEWTCEEMNSSINRYNVTEGFTCLAVGADQMFAEILERRNIPYTVIIPSRDYAKMFPDQGHREKYRSLLSRAREIVELEFQTSSEMAFLEGGRQVVNRSDVIFAVWDGEPAKGIGGTADIVRYALQNHKSVVHLNPNTRRVDFRLPVRRNR